MRIERPGWWIGRGELRRAGEWEHPPLVNLGRGSDREELHVLRRHKWIACLEWSDVVEDDDAPAVCAEHEVVVALVHDHAIDDDSWHVPARDGPVAAAIVRPVETELGSR